MLPREGNPPYQTGDIARQLDQGFLTQLAERVKNQQDIELKPDILYYLFKQPVCWDTIRTIVELTEKSREKYEKQGHYYGGDERAFTLAHSLETSTETTKPGLHIFGPIFLGDPLGYNRKPVLEHEENGDHDKQHQHLIVIHDHPHWYKDDILAPSTIEEIPGSTRKGGDLAELVNERMRREADVEIYGRRPLFTERPIHGIIQAGFKPRDPVKMMLYRESELLATLPAKMYYLWLETHRDRLAKVHNEAEATRIMKDMGYLVSYTELDGPTFWWGTTENIFAHTNIEDLLKIFEKQPESLQLKQFIQTYTPRG